MGADATRALAMNGATVYICGRRKDKLDSVVEELKVGGAEGKVIA